MVVTAQIDHNLCIRCGACMDECPEAALFYEQDNVPAVVPDDCTGCGMCATVCCAEAIILA